MVAKRVIVIGLDGLEPKIVEPMLQRGELPHLEELHRRGAYARIRTTYPAQTPVAWSTFATGVNPGAHGIFDFIRRDPTTYLPDLSLNRYEQKNMFLPPSAVNLRRGTPLWELLSAAGIPSTVIRCPCTYPPDSIRGRMLSGMGVPDLRGGLGTSTFYSTASDLQVHESENVVNLSFSENGTISTHLIGPRNPKTRTDLKFDISVTVDAAQRRVIIRSEGQPRELEAREGEWSDWLKVKFKLGLLQNARGMVRFRLVRMAPDLELYASPINFTPESPLFPISSPPEYAESLANRIGTYYTTGMVEDHGGLNNGRFDEAAYLDQCADVLREREKMMQYELNRMKEGFFFCLFDTPDRLQHMFWRFREPDHPANVGREKSDYARVIEDHYRSCDAIIGNAMQHVNDETLMIVLSDHGFNSFNRGVHLNTWLHDNGLLVLTNGYRPGNEAGDMLRHVDWSRTQAYSLGLGGIYLNVKGREANGIVEQHDTTDLSAKIAKNLSGLRDPERGQTAINSVSTRAQVYSGPYADESPDLIVNFCEGYRSSWGTALGGIPAGWFEDNSKKWSGDHIIDPQLVPGVLFMNRPFRTSDADLRNMAPTILDALGVPKSEVMEGGSLLT